MRSGKLRVLLVTPTFGAYGGIEAFVLGVADVLLHDPRFDVRVCFKRARGFRLEPELAEACATHLPVEFCDRASRPLWDAMAWSDIVHGQNASPDVAVIALLQRRPLVLSIHNILPSRPRARRLAWRAAAVLAGSRWYNSSYVQNTWERAACAGSAVVSPASPLTAIEVPAAARRGFIFVGRLVEAKGVAILVDAYCQAGLDHAQWPLTIVGEGPMRSLLEERVRTRGCRGVGFAGFVNGAAKAARISAAKWLVAPSQWQEPYGMVAVEARSLGVPAIVTADGGLPEAAGRDALVCAPRDTAALAALLRLAAAMHDDEYAARSQRTRRDLDAELVAPGFYADAYLAVVGHAATH